MIITSTSVDINYKGRYTPLGVACGGVHLDIICLLLEFQHSKPNCLDIRGWKPLTAALMEADFNLFARKRQ